MDLEALQNHLRDLQFIAEERDANRLALLFKKLVPDYTPSPQILVFGAEGIEEPKVTNTIHDELLEYRDDRWRPAAFAPATDGS